MSSVFTTSAPQIAALIADIATKLGIEEHEGMTLIKTYLSSIASTSTDAAPASAPAAPKKRKTKTANSSTDVTDASVISTEPTEDDPLRNHKYRLQSINATLCMGRKLDLKNQIVGTRKEDADSNGIFWPEKQCTKIPEPGEKLCRFCKEKDDEVKSGKPADKHYFGRLDEPIYYKACVVGCGDFFAKYPHGIACDPTTAPPAGYVSKITDTANAGKKRGPKPKNIIVPAAAPAPAAAAPVAPAAPAPVPAAVTPVAAAPTEVVPAAPKKTAAKKKQAATKTSIAPIEAEWVVFMYEGRVVARNTKTNYVYEVDADTVDENADIGKIVKKDDYIGAWKNGAVDAYDLSGAAASDEE
jgi:hypothetical protein